MNLLIFEEKFERANTSFKCCKNVEAIKQYNDLLDHILKEEDKEGFVYKPALGSAKNADKQSPYFKITCSTLLNRSSCYLTMNELEFALIDALKYEELVRDQNLDDIRVYLRLGSVYQGMENHQEAIWALEKGLQIKGTDVRLQQLMLKSERALGRPESFSESIDYRHNMGLSHSHDHEHGHSHEHSHEHSHSHSHGHKHSINSGGDVSNPIRRRANRDLSDPRIARKTEKRSSKSTCIGDICCTH